MNASKPRAWLSISCWPSPSVGFSALELIADLLEQEPQDDLVALLRDLAASRVSTTTLPEPMTESFFLDQVSEWVSQAFKHALRHGLSPLEAELVTLDVFDPALRSDDFCTLLGEGGDLLRLRLWLHDLTNQAVAARRSSLDSAHHQSASHSHAMGGLLHPTRKIHIGGDNPAPLTALLLGEKVLAHPPPS